MAAADTRDSPPERTYVAQRLFGSPSLHVVLTLTTEADAGRVHVGAKILDLETDELAAMWAHCSWPIEQMASLLHELGDEVLEVLEALR